jgi:hypothetical protein
MLWAWLSALAQLAVAAATMLRDLWAFPGCSGDTAILWISQEQLADLQVGARG